MNESFWFFLAGIVGGVFGGMGLGGGTLLIPILTLLLHVDGKIAAWLNLLSFLPMSLCTLAIHAKNDFLSWQDCGEIVPYAVTSAAIFSLFCTMVDRLILRRIFGWFLIVVGSISFIVFLVRSAQKKKKVEK